jgi:hypothetical protein
VTDQTHWSIVMTNRSIVMQSETVTRVDDEEIDVSKKHAKKHEASGHHGTKSRHENELRHPGADGKRTMK